MENKYQEVDWTRIIFLCIILAINNNFQIHILYELILIQCT